MVRPKGNPNLSLYHFTTDRDESLTAKLSLRVTDSMLEQIQTQDNWQEFVREAIAEKLQRTKENFCSETNTIVNFFPDLLLIINNQGIIENYWGSHLSQVYGLPTDILKKSIQEVISVSVGEQITEAFARLQVGQSLVNLEYSLVVNEQEEFYEIRLVNLSQPEHFLGIIRNISNCKRVELQLRHNEHLYRAIGETIDYGIWVCQPDGRNIYASESFLNLVGLTQEECSNFGWGNVLHPDDAQETISAWKECSRIGSFWDREHRYRGVDGQWHPILARGVPVRDANGDIICWAGINLDISRLKQTEEKLRESEERFRILADSAPVLIWMNGFEGGCEFVNKAYLDFFGKTLSEVQGLAWSDYLHPDDASYIQVYLKTFKERQPFRAQGRFKRADGQYRWLESRANPRFSSTGEFLGYIGTSSDISEIKEAEEALLQREQRFSTLFNGMEDWILVYPVTEEGHPGNFIEVNEQACKKLGYSREELLQMSVRDIVNTLFINAEINFKKLLSAKHLVLESVHRTKDGENIPVEVSATLFTLNGLPTVQAICRDITERKQIEQERENLLIQEQAAREVAESANRIKDEFLAVLSHELRSPLNPILGWAKLLNTHTLEPATHQKALSIIERNAQLQAELIEDLLDVSRILRGKLTLKIVSVNLGFIIDSAIETIRLAAQAKNIQIQTKLDPNIGEVLGDPARLQQIVWNLLSNAVKFTPTGGKVEIELNSLGNWAKIRVTDTGKGITSDFLPHIFDYFRQADSTTTRIFGGLGLGLAIARHLVELHGGTIKAESLGEGQGATFIVKLPLIPETVQSQKQSSVSPSKTHKKAVLPLTQTHILVVDDEVDTQDFLRFVLEDSGATVTTVASASEALKSLKQSNFNIVICDIGMPETDGYTLIQELRTWEKLTGKEQTPAIALTAYAGEGDRIQAFSAGFQRHLTKPVEPEKLLKTVVDLISQR
ncbi:PAS/PAC sensor hybrid histidine kinase [Gloeothece citriformis PCC 7424]|uniref:Circadian input-output histidine kinase CikA n=1 Tax=Gloeothece citriformis (strain PCC 7424) TaxID=65393 RepID=B7KFL8_GLOC7|nr:PAS domain-containing sensor histidine kinase [Gloeothece citriformis]ACK73343.1 PAS/PAC sensor hybrid histidine kinase [Gloeothece citriformis PCC 7424]